MRKVTLFTSAFLCAALICFYREGKARRHPKKSPSQRASNHIGQERKGKEQELARLKKEIAGYQAELRQHEKMEQHSRKNLSAYNRRTAELQAAIAKLEDQVEALQEQKSEVDESLRETTSTLQSLKQSYAQSSQYLYMHGALDTISAAFYPFEPGKQEERLRMSYYAHAIGEAHAMNRERLDSMKTDLRASSSEIASTLHVNEREIGVHTSEASALETKKAEEARQLVQIEQNKERLRKLLKDRTASEKRLENIIANLVTKEAAHRTVRRHRENSNRSRTPEFESDEPIGRAYGPHSLSWPCSSHHIAQSFGEHRNSELNTVTMNLGIDIDARQGSSAVAAAEGEVSLVSSLPSYGTIVVLQHAGGLHTVYADLASASVSTGMHVRAGQQLGKIGANEESGPVLHFEVWKGKVKQNPIGWLK